MRTKNKEKMEQLFEKRQAEILDAAGIVFSKYGFAKTTIDRIASQAGLGKGTVYQYFKSKKELFLLVGRNGMDRLKDTVLVEIEKEADPIKQIEIAIKAYLLFFQENSKLAGIFMQEQGEFRRETQKRYFEHYYGHIDMMRKIFKKAVKKGLLKDVDVENLNNILISLLNGLVYMWQAEGMKYSLTDRIPMVLKVFFTGIVKDEKRRQKYEKAK
ncbi:MAG: TetR/AcrR family transcriptional regulator [Candidatus Omnitrophica bacterium]|nr:TetR/AcrR family transcriptional regulator [Candidatus Omnitrophota bacterium]